MDDLSSMINNVLNDPEALGKIESLAKELNLGGGQNDAPLNLGALGGDNKNVALLKALKPFLSEKRAKKVDDAVKIMGLLKLAPLLKEDRK